MSSLKRRGYKTILSHMLFALLKDHIKCLSSDSRFYELSSIWLVGRIKLKSDSDKIKCKIFETPTPKSQSFKAKLLSTVFLLKKIRKLKLLQLEQSRI